MAIDDEKKRRAAKDVPLGGDTLKPDGAIDADDRRSLAGDYSTFTVSSPTVPVSTTPTIPAEISPTPTEPLPTTSTSSLADVKPIQAPIHDVISVDKQSSPIGNIARLDNNAGYGFSIRASQSWTNYYASLDRRVNNLHDTLGSIDFDPHIQSYAPGGFTILSGQYAIMVDHLTLNDEEEAVIEGDGELVIL